MLLLQKQLIDQVNNNLVVKKEENGVIRLPYKAVYGTPTKSLNLSVDSFFQWCVNDKDTTPIDIDDWSRFLKVKVAEIDRTIPMQLPDIRTRICGLDIHRIYILSNIPVELDKETVGLMRAEFSLRFGFSNGLCVPLSLYLSLYDVDCLEDCVQDSKTIAFIPIGKNFIDHVSKIFSVLSPFTNIDHYCERLIEDQMKSVYYKKVRDSYKLFRDDISGPTFIDTVKIETLSPKSLTEHLRDLLIKLIKDDSKFYTVTKNMI